MPTITTLLSWLFDWLLSGERIWQDLCFSKDSVRKFGAKGRLKAYY